MSEQNTFEIEPDAMTVLDRSTLERWETCPAQAAMFQVSNPKPSRPMVVGIEVHKAISRMIADYISDPLPWSTLVCRDELTNLAECARADVKDDVVDAIKCGRYAIGRFVSSLSPARIVAYDEGEGDRSSQLAMTVDWYDFPLTLTGALDLLYTSDSEQELQVVDWKSGWSSFSSTTVKQSFQFQFYSWLVFHAFESIDSVIVRVFMTRSAEFTSPVRFVRDDLDKLTARIRAAADVWERWRRLNVAPGWPEQTKCNICPVVSKCIHADGSEVSMSPTMALERYMILQAGLDKLKKDLTAYVDKEGPIALPNGNAFGRVPTNKPTAKVYKCESTQSTG